MDNARLRFGLAPMSVHRPLVIDDTRIDRAPLPDPFKRSQGKSLLDGNVTPDTAELLIGLVRDFHRRQRAA